MDDTDYILLAVDAYLRARHLLYARSGVPQEEIPTPAPAEITTVAREIMRRDLPRHAGAPGRLPLD